MVNMHVYYICPHRAITTKQGIITGPIMEKQGHYENEKKMAGMLWRNCRLENIFSVYD